MADRPRRSLSTPNIRSASPQRGGGNDISISSRLHKPDYWLIVLASLLLTIGLVVVYSISPGLAASQHVSQNHFIIKQLLDVGLGVISFAVASYVPLKWWRNAAPILVSAAIIGSIIVMFMPIDSVYRAHRWIIVGGFSFQIVELIKLALLIWLASFLANRWQAGKLNDFKTTLKPLLITFLIIGLVVAKFQSDLGSTGVMVGMIVSMAFIAGLPLKKAAIIVLLVIILATAAISTSSYRRERLATYLHPESNCQNAGYQACQALIAVGSGGLFGLGLGYSVQAYGYLPEASNDSIFAIIAEKFGFIGSTLLVGIYAVFISRFVKIIERSNNQFNRLLGVGVLAWFSTQMIINIGAMLGLLPLKGITLPFVSQGGTSLVFLTAALGLVFQISRYTSYSAIEPIPQINEKPRSYNNSDRRGFGRPHNPGLVSRPRT